MTKTSQLTLTRFAAALTVVVFHYGQKVWPFTVYPISELIPTGNIFVSYFFALSGFIMMLAYWSQPGRFQAWRYWVFRLGRVYPVYLLGLALTILLRVKYLKDTPAVALNLTLLQAWLPPYPNTLNYPGWSLSVEAFFYLFFPLIFIIAKKLSLKTSAILIGLFWLASQAGHTYLLQNHYSGFPSFSHDVIFYNPLLHLNTFLLGGLAGRWYLERGVTLSAKKLLNSVMLIASFLLIGLSLLYLKDSFKQLFGIRVALTNGILAPLFILFITTLALDNTWIARTFQSPALVLLGDASYAVYILQFPAHTFYKKYLEGYFPNASNEFHFYAYLILLLAISVATFLWVETPARNLVKRLYDRLTIKSTARRESWVRRQD
jgi:peptidoglycan/LPS O-acetylase OafA/YrhL